MSTRLHSCLLPGEGDAEHQYLFYTAGGQLGGVFLVCNLFTNLLGGEAEGQVRVVLDQERLIHIIIFRLGPPVV